jgi:adenylate cyclase
MGIRLKIVLIVVPLIIATLLLTGISSYFAATSGISRIAKDFLGFKAQELEKQAESQWGLLVANKLTDRPEMVAATQAAVDGYARTIIRSPTELILAVAIDGTVTMSTAEPAASAPGKAPASPWVGDEQAAAAALARTHNGDFLSVRIGGRDRVAKAFWFAPFGWYVMVTEERAAFYDQVNQITFRTLVILAGSIGAGILLTLILANYLMRPLTRVAGAMKDIISTNDLSKRVVVEYRDEIGQLAHTFNLMVGELEKAYGQIKGYAFRAANNKKKEEKIRDLFQRYVPADIIDSIFANTESLLVGKNEQVAVLFSDIRSFTTISEQLGRPDELVESLNRYFTVMVDVIMDRHGIIDKYIGDAIKAFFGAPVKREDDPLNAVLSGVEMVEALKGFNDGQERLGKPAFKIGIGINYGEATIGNIGTEKKMDFTAIGDMVNLASRLEGLTKEYHQQLIFSESLYAPVKGQVTCRLLDTVAAKGMPRGLRIYTAQAAPGPREKEAWGLHNAAMEDYYARNFTRASARFADVLKLLPADHPAELLLARSQGFQRNPPPDAWTGVAE